MHCLVTNEIPFQNNTKRRENRESRTNLEVTNKQRFFFQKYKLINIIRKVFSIITETYS